MLALLGAAPGPGSAQAGAGPRDVGAGPACLPPAAVVPPHSTTDRDRDGLTDACELLLAQRFAPELIVSAAACNWSDEERRLEGGYLFAVGWAAEPGGDLRIAYLPAYLQDCGWEGPKCWLRWRGGCDPHAGDSEIVIADADPAARRVVGIFLSSHCFGGSDGDCRWYRGADLEQFAWRTRDEIRVPAVWVAEGKNANYPNRVACDRGHWSYDTCDRNARVVTFPVAADRNVGSRQHPLGSDGCFPRRSGDLPEAGAVQRVECIWAVTPFRGWQGPDVPGATPYLRYLTGSMGYGEGHPPPR